LDLAYQAIEIERDVWHESVGCQDQTFAAMGGFNLIEFRSTRDIIVHRIPLTPERQKEFEEHLMLVYTGIRRRASTVAARQVRNIDRNSERLKRIRRLVDESHSILVGGSSLAPFGRLLHESWILKNQLDAAVSNEVINNIYVRGLEAGALGGKLLGAGGGGFLLFFVPPERRSAIAQALGHLEEIPIGVNAPGTQIIHAALPSRTTHSTSPTGGNRMHAA
jgi:D-glycero-alpha-D-manno-heptose-7-phosphate kinase